MRPFYLTNTHQPPRVVVVGVEFDNGIVCLQWQDYVNSVCFYMNIDHVRKLHVDPPVMYPKVFEWGPQPGARLFVLDRMEDETGQSGTGVVAQGIEFGDGAAALVWQTELPSMVTYPNIKRVEKIHGHGGRTVIRFSDPAAAG